MERQSPPVSVMMPAYNAEKHIARAIESVLAQDYDRWELVVVDDGSLDGTAEVVGSFQDSRIRLIRQKNGGEATARNTALKHIHGKYLAFLDSDDLFLPRHLRVTVSYLESHPERDAVYTDGHHIDQNGNRRGTLSSNRRGPFEGRIYEEVVRASDVFGPPICVVLRSDMVTKARLTFDPRIVIGPDWDFLTRVADVAEFGYIDEATCLYRVHQTNITVLVDSRRRSEYLAICRGKAIKMPSFSQCSADTRSAVFYDLLINLQGHAQDRQKDIAGWPEFHALPLPSQARLYRLMASNALLQEGGEAFVRYCLHKSRNLDPSDTRTRILGSLFELSPLLSRVFVRVRRRLKPERPGTSPFESLAQKSGRLAANEVPSTARRGRGGRWASS